MVGDGPSDGVGWQLRLRDDHGHILGAGILIAPDLALTCAHILPHPGAELTVDYAGYLGVEPSRARAVPGAVHPYRDDPPDGDVALLSVDPPRAGVEPAPLRRISHYVQRPVRMCGFPEGADHGLWVDGVIAGRAGSWMQVNPSDPAYAVEAGFSGAAVAGDRLDGMSARPRPLVLGMVVARFHGRQDGTTEARRHAYMLPLDRIAELLPAVAALAGGRPRHPASLVSRTYPAESQDTAFAHRLTAWFAGDGPDVKVSVIEEVSPRAVALSRRLQLPDDGAVESWDAAGRSTGRLAAQLVERLAWPDDYGGRLGAWLQHGGRRPVFQDSGDELTLPLTLAVVGADTAADPHELVRMLSRLHTLGCRLLVVFRREAAPGWAEVQELLLVPALRRHARELLDTVIRLEKQRHPRRRVSIERIAEYQHCAEEPRPGRLDALLDQLRQDITRLEAGA